jgi:hypothetical protein
LGFQGVSIRIEWERVFVREYRYSLTGHDPQRPWIVLESRRLVVELEDDDAFFEWASREWPRDRFTVELDPWQLRPS